MTFRRLSVLALIIGPAMIGVACSDETPSAPIAVAAASGSTFARGSDKALPGTTRLPSAGSNQAALVWCENHGPATASADIGPSGGIIAVGNARLILPAGALATTVRVVATQPGGPNATVSFEPSGLQFKNPAGLQFDVSGCDVSRYTPDVVYLNEEGVIVERIEAVYSNYWRQVAAPVKHFSSYALAW